MCLFALVQAVCVVWNGAGRLLSSAFSNELLLYTRIFYIVQADPQKTVVEDSGRQVSFCTNKEKNNLKV